MKDKFHNVLHKKAIEDSKIMGESHNNWAHDLLRRLHEYWLEQDTPLPDIELFDEVAHCVHLGEKDGWE